MVGVPINVLNRLLAGVDPHLCRTGKFSGAIYNSRFQHARPEFAAVVKTRDTLKKRICVIRHIACADHTIGEVERTIIVAEMLVIVPQPRHEEAALGIDYFRVRRWFNIGVRSDADNAFATHHDACCRRDAKVAGIE